MTTLAIRKQLMNFFASADDKKVKAIYTLVENELNQEDIFNLTNEHIKILDQRKAGHLNGTAKAAPWNEVHKRIRKKG